MKKLTFSSTFCEKIFGYPPVKLSLLSPPASALHSRKLNSYHKNTTRSVLVSLALFSLSCLPVHAGTGNGLTANYRTGLDAANSPIVLTRTDATVNFDWGTSSPAPGVPVDRFSVKWYGFIEPKYTEEYTFYTTGDEGESLLINGTQIINDTTDHTARTASGKVKLQAGVKYPIILYYFEKTGAASMKLEWSSANQSREVVPTSQLYGVAPTLTPTYFRGRPSITSQTIVTDEGTLLRGDATFILSDDASDYLSKYALDVNNYYAAASRKLNYVRLSISPHVEKDHIGYIDKIVQNAEAAGMYVSINFAPLPPIGGAGQWDYQGTYDFWNVIAARYKDHPNVIYEITNEPDGSFPSNGSYNMDNISGIYTIYNMMRSAAPDTIIITGTSSKLTYDNNSHNVVVFHNYQDPISQTTISDLIGKYPLIMNETNGWQYGDNTEYNFEREARRIRFQEQYGISWAMQINWGYFDASGVKQADYYPFTDNVLEQYDQMAAYFGQYGISWH